MGQNHQSSDKDCASVSRHEGHNVSVHASQDIEVHGRSVCLHCKFAEDLVVQPRACMHTSLKG